MQEQKRIVGVAEHAGYLILRLRYYPAWGVKVNGIAVTPKAEKERGLMAVPVPQGRDLVSVDWTTTVDVVEGRWVSGVALVLVIALYSFERKRLRATEEPNLHEVELKHSISSVRTGSRNTLSGKQPRTTRGE